MDNIGQEPKKQKKGLLGLLGFGGNKEVKNLGHVNDPIDEDDEDFSDDVESSEPPPATNKAGGGKKRVMASLLDDDEDDDQDAPPPPVTEPVKKGGGLLGLLDDDDDEECDNVPSFPESIVSWDDEDDDDEEKPSVVEEFEDDDLYSSDVDVEENPIETYTPPPIQEETIPPPPPEPTYHQAIEEVVNAEPEPTETRADILANAGYCEIIETLATKVMVLHEIPNISLESFGAVATTYKPSVLTVTNFGKHLFVGNPLSDKQKIMLFCQIEGLVEKAEREGNDKVVLSATQLVQHEGIPYRTLLLSDEILEDYMNTYNRTIMTNGDVANIDSLAVIITL